MSRTIYLTRMKKQRGGRIKDMESYRAICGSNTIKTNSDAWMIAKRSLKTPEDVQYDAFTHVLESSMKNTPIIVKIQNEGVFSKKETDILSLLTNKKQNNIIGIICKFTCKDDILRWTEHAKEGTQFCKGGKDTINIIAMEYIANTFEDIRYLDNSEEITTNVLKQLLYALMEMNITNAIMHGDLHIGNILIDIDDPEEKIYTIANKKIHLKTFGYHPILVDFQMGSIGNVSEIKGNILRAIDEIQSILYRLSNSLPEYKDDLTDLINTLYSCKSFGKLLEIIDEFELE